MATPPSTTPSPFYGFLTSIRGKVDDTHWQLMKLLIDKINSLDGQAQAIGTVSKPLTAPLNASTQNLTNVKDPILKQDAATKNYVDSQIAAQMAVFAQSNLKTAPTTTPHVVSPPSPGPAPSGVCLMNIAGGQPGGVPAAPNLRWFRGDFIGMNVPGLGAVPGGGTNQSLAITFLLDQYSPADQQTILNAYTSRNYTHFVLSWPDSRSASTRGGVNQTITQFVATAQKVQAAGLYPVIFLSSKDFDTPNTTTILSGLTPLLSALKAASVIPIACVGWELSIWLNPTQVQALIDGISAIVVPGTNLYVHFQEGYASFQQPGTTTATFWTPNVGKLTGLLHQKIIGSDCAQYQTAASGCLADVLARFNGGFGYPSDSGFGHPFDCVAYEYSATPRFQNAITEGQAQGIGQQAISTPPAGSVHVMGYCNGGPNV